MLLLSECTCPEPRTSWSSCARWLAWQTVLERAQLVVGLIDHCLGLLFCHKLYLPEDSSQGCIESSELCPSVRVFQKGIGIQIFDFPFVFPTSLSEQ